MGIQHVYRLKLKTWVWLLCLFANADKRLPTKDVGLDILGMTITSRSFVVLRDDDIFAQDEYSL